MPRQIELLAPAKDVAVARDAILCGADAVYIGATSHGARAAAANSVNDIAGLCEWAHSYCARVYVTLNTIVYDRELKQVERLISDLYYAGVDALIVQDMGILRLDIPPIPLHASTQCDIRDPRKARWLEQLGFSQLVLARELSLKEIEEIHQAVKVPLEVFVHGALCVSYSGDCQASQVLKGRSANRGECAQICRLPYRLLDGDGNIVSTKGAHLLSLRDLNRSQHLGEMLTAGVSSFKIEGRLKDAAYVRNVTAAYRGLLDYIIAANPESYCRSSLGVSDPGFAPDLTKSFNRSYTDYFLTDTREPGSLASMRSPKDIGQPVGKVKKVLPGRIVLDDSQIRLHNGDGLGYFDQSSEFKGFRVNTAAVGSISPARPQTIPSGTLLYRNYDKQWEDAVAHAQPQRLIPISLSLSALAWGLALDATINETGQTVTVSQPLELAPAKTPQEAQRRANLTKWGGTIFDCREVEDRVGEMFVPASVISSLRRAVAEALGHCIAATRKVDYRLKEDPSAEIPAKALTYHDNVANRLSRKLVTDHGASEVADAIEVKQPTGEKTVMTTRYCLRRELGRCLLTPEGRLLKGPLTLQGPGGITLHAHFDCPRCRMLLSTR